MLYARHSAPRQYAAHEIIRFVPRTVAKAMKPTQPSALISIRDTKDAPPALEGNWAQVLSLAFDDKDVPELGVVLFDEVQARQVKAFAEAAHAQGQCLVVHCFAGISRSAAVAMALGDYFGLAVYKETLPCPGNYALYNRRVFRELLNVLHDYDDE